MKAQRKRRHAVWAALVSLAIIAAAVAFADYTLQGVKVVSYDLDVAEFARSLFFNQAKGDSLAEMMLESMGQMIGYEGDFAILSSTPTATNQNAWIDFMKKKMQEPKFAKMKLVQIAYGQESEQVNQQQALALVQAFPTLKGIIIPAGIGLPVAARAMEQAGRLGKVKLTRPRAGNFDQELHSKWLGAGYLVERQKSRIPDVLRRSTACSMQAFWQGR